MDRLGTVNVRTKLWADPSRAGSVVLVECWWHRKNQHLDRRTRKTIEDN